MKFGVRLGLPRGKVRQAVNTGDNGLEGRTWRWYMKGQGLD